MKTIKVGDKETIVSDSDFEYLNQFTWFISNTGYPRNKDGLMHKFIIDSPFVHHINGDKLDNRRSNLEPKNSQTHHLGGAGKIYRRKDRSPEGKVWEVRVQYKGNRKRLGLFEDPFTAQMVYDMVWEELHGLHNKQ